MECFVIGYQLKAVEHIAKQLYARKLGALRAGSWDDQKLDKEHWQKKKAVRTKKKTMRNCTGDGVRTMVVLEKPPKRKRVEGEQEDEQEGEEGEESGEVEGEQGKQVAVKKGKQSLLKEVFQQVKEEFEKWRLGGLYVDNQDLL